MKPLRKKRFLRCFAAFTILTLLVNIVSPTVTYALTTGQHQPEYVSYEDASSTDMVNLLTGDLAYNMPLLTVPAGLEAGFTIPLSYHAGFAPETEASWVGLGWNVNVGSLTRTINGFPDDAAGETQTVRVQDSGTRGWSATILGTTIGWDKQIGHYGVLNLGVKVGYENGSASSVGLAGLTVAGGKASFSAQEFAMTVIRVAIAVATYGASEAGAWATQLAWDLGTQLVADAIATGYSPDVQANGYWKFSKHVDKKLFVTKYDVWLDQSRYEDMWGTLYLDRARTETFTDKPNTLSIKQTINGANQTSIKRFEVGTPGTYYLKGSASDINIDLGGNADYSDNTSAVALAYDNFSVSAPGISGTIKPYRLEVGSVSVPREMTPDHVRLAPIPYLQYKVPFVYEGDLGSPYYHHVGAANGETVDDLSFNFGIDAVVESNNGSPVNLRYTMDDAVFGAQRIAPANNGTKRVAQGQYIEWLTNQEIKNATNGFLPSAFVDYFAPQDRISQRTSFSFQGGTTMYSTNSTFPDTRINFSTSTVASNYFAQNDMVDIQISTYASNSSGGSPVFSGPFINYTVRVSEVGSNYIRIERNFTPEENSQITNASSISITVKGKAPRTNSSIGGFVITGANGMSYHFALPVYDYFFESGVLNSTDEQKKSTISRVEPFANTWLLTAITGADFVDRGGSNNAANGMVDDSDWGYWVKFNYGRHNTDFQWRIPFNDYKIDATGTSKSYATGHKEQYYLNSVETRSHTALFIKDERLDSRSKNNKTSLRLSEIALVTKETYKAMITAGLPAAAGRVDVSYKVADFTGTKGTLLLGNSIRRVIFNTDYTLCPGTTNSSAPGGGKLTLKGLSMVGKNNAKIFPDYVFGYGVNPAFNANQWDGWGMYNSLGTTAASTHGGSETNADAWCLNKVTSPEGAIIDFVYERDSYSSISGNELSYGWTYSQDDVVLPTGGIYTVPTAAGSFAVGDAVHVTGFMNYKCSNGSWGPTTPIDVTSVVTSITNGLTLQHPFISLTAFTCQPENSKIDYIEIDVRKKIEKTGGNLRVASVQLSEVGGQSIKTRYLYDGADNVSSGVVSQETEYSRERDYDFYHWLQYPMTPVFYKTVSVLSGKLTTDSDYHTKQVFEFETPDTDQYVPGKIILQDKVLAMERGVSNNGPRTMRDYVSVYKHQIQDWTSKIGKLKSAKTYDKQNVCRESLEYFYTSEPKNTGVYNFQGISSEGTVMMDYATVYSSDGNLGTNEFRYNKVQRTSILRYPYTLEKVVATADGFTSSNENKSWDLATGMVLESVSTDRLGMSTLTVVEPAYTHYPELGSKVNNPLNRNMLSQTVASYVYRLGASGTPIGLISASATRWRKDWDNYRILNASGDAYTSGSDLADGQTGVWRRADSYVWKGEYARLNTNDGTLSFSPSDKFNFTTLTNNVLWQKIGDISRYNHYSFMLETEGFTGLYNTSKLGYGDQLQIASGSNARYMELAYSGAEDRASTKFFGGEVSLGAGIVVSGGHTGAKALSVSSGKGFVYVTDGLVEGSSYKACVWTNSANGRLYYRINGGSEVLSDPPREQRKIGGWYLLEMANIPYGASVEVGVSSAGGGVLFDDFKFQPEDATVECYVYQSQSGRLTHVLGNDHTYTRFEYSDAGRMTKIYKESFRYGEKLISETRENYKRFND